MMTILYCCDNESDIFDKLRSFREELWNVNVSTQMAKMQFIGLQIMFRSFRNPGDEYKVFGYELKGILNFEAVQGTEMRQHILARLRP